MKGPRVNLSCSMTELVVDAGEFLGLGCTPTLDLLFAEMFNTGDSYDPSVFLIGCEMCPYVSCTKKEHSFVQSGRYELFVKKEPAPEEDLLLITVRIVQFDQNRSVSITLDRK